MNGYPVVVDMATIVPNAIASGVHVLTLLAQAGLAVTLLLSGLRKLVRADGRLFGAVRLGLGVALVLPFATGAPFVVSLLACLAAFGVLAFADRGRVGAGGIRRFAHGAGVGAALVLGAFILWEREDALDLGMEIVTTARDWRTHESEWQKRADATAPKLGELAPDFELQDPSGRTSVRLSDFRGKHPVALVFGSYT